MFAVIICKKYVFDSVTDGTHLTETPAGLVHFMHQMFLKGTLVSFTTYSVLNRHFPRPGFRFYSLVPKVGYRSSREFCQGRSPRSTAELIFIHQRHSLNISSIVQSNSLSVLSSAPSSYSAVGKPHHQCPPAPTVGGG